jgi:hypothetical protein
VLRRYALHVADADAERISELVRIPRRVDELLQLRVIQLPARRLPDHLRRLGDLVREVLRVERVPVREVDPGVVVGQRDLEAALFDQLDVPVLRPRLLDADAILLGDPSDPRPAAG